MNVTEIQKKYMGDATGIPVDISSAEAEIKSGIKKYIAAAEKQAKEHGDYRFLRIAKTRGWSK